MALTLAQSFHDRETKKLIAELESVRCMEGNVGLKPNGWSGCLGPWEVSTHYGTHQRILQGLISLYTGQRIPTTSPPQNKKEKPVYHFGWYSWPTNAPLSHLENGALDFDPAPSVVAVVALVGRVVSGHRCGGWAAATRICVPCWRATRAARAFDAPSGAQEPAARG